jgi:hypothetical protein
MKKLSVIISCVILIILGCKSEDGGGGGGDQSIPAAGDEDYTAEDYEPIFKMWDHFGIAYTDADKTDSGDDKMCWAVAAANLLVWSGWAVDEDDAFTTFRSHFDNQPGDLYDALSYYFDNFVSNAGADTVTVREARSHMLMDFTVSALHEGKGIALKIKYPGQAIGHYVTVFGYMYFADEDNFILMFTDSDDRLHQLRNFKVLWNEAADRWEIQGLYERWYLEYVISLDRMETSASAPAYPPPARIPTSRCR